MRIMLVSSCKSDSHEMGPRIGAFKRCIRIGLEMKRRGHEVWLACTDYHLWSDGMTRTAEELLEFVNPDCWYSATPHLANRNKCQRILEATNLDLVVLDEVSLTGSILDSAICTICPGIRVVLLGSAHSPLAAEALCAQFGPMVEGIVLIGLSSFHPAGVPAYYCGAPPLIEKSEERALNFLADLGLCSDRLITVLAGGKRAEDLAVDILNALPDLDCHSVFLSNDLRRSFSALAGLPFSLRRKIRVLSPPEDDVLFGFLELSRLAIGTCGFMQIAESLALQTPFVGVRYPGGFDPKLLPPEAASFVHATDSAKAAPTTIAAAARFFKLPPGALSGLHIGQFGAAPLIAAFLERLATNVRSATAQAQR